MKMKAKRISHGLLNKGITYAIIFTICIFLVGFVYGFSKTEYIKKPIVKEKVDSKDYKYLYSFYVGDNPDVNLIVPYGNKNSSLTMILFIDIDDADSRTFMREIFPRINQSFISTGKLRFYRKSYVSSSDFKARNNKYLYAQSISCVKSIRPDRFYDYYFGLFGSNASPSIIEAAAKYGIGGSDFENCLNGSPQFDVVEDISENEKYGIVLNPRIYIGIAGTDNTVLEGPDYDQLIRTINLYELKIGDSK